MSNFKTKTHSVALERAFQFIIQIKILRPLKILPFSQVGKTSVNIGAHPDARIYCINLLAAKLVRQGEDQVASSIQAAFPVAALAVGLWTEFKEVGHHLLAHFYSVCPVLVPMYVSRTKDMSEAEYMK